MTNIKTLITNEKVRRIIAILAAVIMYFTPDHIDTIIEAGLVAFGISTLVVHKKEE